MAAISRRPRLALSSAAALMAAACSLVAPVEPPADGQARAQALAVAGKHAEAARAYAELAALMPADHDNEELLSAEQWLAAGNIPQARQALAAVSADAHTKLPASRALVSAEVALAEKDATGALHELDSIGVPAAPDLAQNYWYIRGEASFMAGHPVDGVRAFVERERYLSDPAALGVSRAELLDKIRSAADHGQSLKVPPKSDPTLAGWLQLGPVAADLQHDAPHAATALENWRRLYPDHPATPDLVAPAPHPVAAASGLPAQIALLLPLSGRSEAVGTAVRDGFIAAYLDQEAGNRPRLRIYDVAADSVAGAYRHALEDGADFVVGPLTKEDVAAIVPLATGHAPLLALNFLADSAGNRENIYQFALLPEDEARIVARHLAAEGKLKGVAILPDGEWGTRVGTAFADELTHLGGSVLDSGRYEPSRADFSDVIRQTLQIHGAKGETPSHRSDVDFIFVAGTPGPERLLVSQLKFHYAGDIPVFSTSDSFEPDAGANGDLDGLSFPDMPWMVSTDPVTERVRDAVRSAWPARAVRRDRLYAFGCDAYALVAALNSKTLGGAREIAGVTGRLRLDDQNRIRRDLDWVQMKSGVPAAL